MRESSVDRVSLKPREILMKAYAHIACKTLGDTRDRYPLTTPELIRVQVFFDNHHERFFSLTAHERGN